MPNPRYKGNNSSSEWRLQPDEEALICSPELHIKARKTQRCTRHIDKARCPAKASYIFERPTEHDQRRCYAEGYQVREAVELGAKRTLSICQTRDSAIEPIKHSRDENRPARLIEVPGHSRDDGIEARKHSPER